MIVLSVLFALVPQQTGQAPVSPGSTESRPAASRPEPSQPALPAPGGLLAQLDVERSAAVAMLRRAFVSVAVERDSRTAPLVFYSGTLIDGRGRVVAPAQAVEGARLISVLVQDGRHFVATPVLSDAELPVSILQLEGSDFPPAPALGGSAQLGVGHSVALIANAEALDGTTSFGTVSGVGRRVARYPRIDLVQTTLPLHRGSIGGAIGNARGEVVAVLVGGAELDENEPSFRFESLTESSPEAPLPPAVSASGGRSLSRTARDVETAPTARSELRVVRIEQPARLEDAGITLAFPIDRARALLEAIPDSIVAPGSEGLRRPVLGVVLNERVDDVVRAQLRLRDGGLVIESVFEGSAAQRAGVERFDILLRIDGVRVNRNEQVHQILRDAGSKTAISLQVLRAGDVVDIDVSLAPATRRAGTGGK